MEEKLNIDELLQWEKEAEERLKDRLDARANLTSMLLGGVYLLMNDERVLYVGETRCFARRVTQHLSDNRIPFGRIEVIIEFDDLKRISLERDLIKKFEPPYNGKGNANVPVNKRHYRRNRARQDFIESREFGGIDPEFDE